MLQRSLKKYLIEPKDLTGHPAEPFERPQVLDDLTFLTRNDARRYIRDVVGQHVYAARRPIRSDSSHTAITIRQLSDDSILPLWGEDDTLASVLQVDVWARGGDADHRSTQIGKLIRIAVNNYAGLWGTSIIMGVAVRRQGSLPIPPGNATDDWPFRYSMDFEVKHIEAAAIYPVELLTARITTRLRV